MEQFTIAGCFRPVCDNVSIVAVLMGKEILGETIFAAVSRSANGVEHWQSDTLPAAKVVARKPRDGDCLGALKRSIQLSQASSNEDRERWSISATFRDRTLQVVGRERRDKLNHIHWEVILKPAADGFAVAELISRGVATLLTWSEVAAKKVETAEETIRVQQRTIEIMTASKRSLEIELFSAFHHTLNYHRMRVQQQRSSSMKPERDTQVAATRRSHFSDDENNEEEDEGSQNFETYGDSMVMDNERIVNLHELSQPGHVGATDIENVSGHLALSRKRKQRTIFDRISMTMISSAQLNERPRPSVSSFRMLTTELQSDSTPIGKSCCELRSCALFAGSIHQSLVLRIATPQPMGEMWPARPQGSM